MNDTISKNWNSVVGKKDTVYHLGDFIFGNKSKLIREFLDSLNGRIVLIKGDHDKSVLNPTCRSRFDSVYDTYFLKVDTQYIVLDHHCRKSWKRSHYGVWHGFGHHHGNLNEYAAGEGKLMDMWVGNNNFTPFSWEQVKAIMDTRPLNFNDIRRKNI